jgi:hypothetical protein
MLEFYFRYNYRDLPVLYYTVYNQSNEKIHGLTKDKDITDMLNKLVKYGVKKLHIFVDD